MVWCIHGSQRSHNPQHRHAQSNSVELRCTLVVYFVGNVCLVHWSGCWQLQEQREGISQFSGQAPSLLSYSVQCHDHALNLDSGVPNSICLPCLMLAVMILHVYTRHTVTVYDLHYPSHSGHRTSKLHVACRQPMMGSRVLWAIVLVPHSATMMSLLVTVLHL